MNSAINANSNHNLKAFKQLNLNLQNRQSRRKHASSILKQMKTNQIIASLDQDEIKKSNKNNKKNKNKYQQTKSTTQINQINKTNTSKSSQVNISIFNISNSYKQKNKHQVVKGDDIVNENAVKLIKFITGGYDNDQYNDFLSLSAFNRIRQNFAILNDLYQRVASSSEIRRLNINKLTDHTLLAVVYVNQNIGKMKRHQIQEIFKKLKMVW